MTEHSIHLKPFMTLVLLHPSDNMYHASKRDVVSRGAIKARVKAGRRGRINI